jgi:DNA recombination protein RmuC
MNLTFPSLAINSLAPEILAAGLGGSLLLVVLVLLLVVTQQGKRRRKEEEARAQQARMMEVELAELRGRLAQIAEASAFQQSNLAEAIQERMERLGSNLGQNVMESGRLTVENLSRMQERLAVIDAAQKQMAEVSSRVLSLQEMFANKQARGAFGQARMEAIIEDGLPRSAFTFQATLSNGKRPDCLIRIPHATAAIVIDAKFPLDAFEALRAAKDETMRKAAQARVRSDVGQHIADMAAKYFIPGETQDIAMLFVPAESLYLELHENFPDLIQRGFRERIVIVSPNTLMLAVHTMASIMKDVRMREQAGVIQKEVAMLLEDVERLKQRLSDFAKQFAQLGPHLEKIMTSSDKIVARATRIEAIDVGDGAAAEKTPLAAAAE